MLRLHDAETDAPVEIEVRELVIAGWAGRDRAKVEEHIRELEALGVQRPSSIPCYYRVGRELLTSAPEVQVLGTGGSGEAEVLLATDGDGTTWVGLASDHTDREVEAYSVAVSKQMCPKPLGRQVWRYAAVADHWDRLVLRAHATIAGERVLYQEGTVDGLLPPEELFRGYNGTANLGPGQAMLCGTLPAKGGVRPTGSFEMELIDPVRNRRLVHSYSVRPLPVVA